jgi:hypothetical protein
MTNGSGPTQPPAPRAHILSGVAEQSARIVRLPDALSSVARAQRLEGEVLQQNKDGSIRVHTEQGDLDIQVRGRQPQAGQVLQVDVPAGRPPRQVIIRQSAPPPAPPQTAADEPAIQTRIDTQAIRAQQAVQRVVADQAPLRTNTAAPSTPPSSGGVRPQVSLPPQPLPPSPGEQAGASRPAPLPAGTAVRLLPVAPAQAQQIVQATTLNLVQLPTQLSRVTFAANLIAQSIQDTASQAVLQIRAPDVTALTAALRGVVSPTSSFQANNYPPLSTQSAPSTPLAQAIRQFLNLPAPVAAQGSAPATTYGPPQQAISLTQSPLGNLPQMTQLPNAGGPSPLATLMTAGITGDTAGLVSSSFTRISQMDVRLLNIQPPGVTLSAPTVEAKAQGLPVPGLIKIAPTIAQPQAPAGTLTAQVTGITAQNLPLVTLQWPGSSLPQSFVLQFNAANLPVGSQITVQPQNIVMSQPGTTGAVPGQLSPGTAPIPPGLLSLFGPGPWPVLDEAYQTLLQSAPMAAQALARTLPSPANPSQLGSTALLFIAAVRSGDIGSWLGDKKIDILQRASRTNILGRLTQDLSTLAQRTADSASSTGDWRAVPLPMFWEGEIQKVSLFVKNQGGGRSEDDSKEGQTRFIFDLDLNRMGGVQLDGLVRGKRFDLVLRTQMPLSNSMQQAMRHSYSQALQHTELHGDLSFQGDIKNWVNVLQQDSNFGASA